MLNQKICREHASKCIETANTLPPGRQREMFLDMATRWADHAAKIEGSEPLLHLFQQWLIAFEKTQSATRDEEPVAALALSGIESRIATTPAEGLRGVVVKLGLDRFLQEHADTASEQADSAYADLVRLTGHDPVTEILAKLRL